MIEWLQEEVEIRRWQQLLGGFAVMALTLRALVILVGWALS